MKARRRWFGALLGMIVLAAFGSEASSASAANTSNIVTRNTPIWAGYSAQSSAPSFAWLASVWVVPTVACPVSGTTNAVQWAGVGGVTANEPLYQIGTETDCTPQKTGGSKADDFAWFEVVPKYKTSFDLSKTRYPVAHGDHMTGSISVSGSQINMTIADFGSDYRGFAYSPKWIFTDSEASTRTGFRTVECIVERPMFVNALHVPYYNPLSEFGSALFPYVPSKLPFTAAGCNSQYQGAYFSVANGFKTSGVTTYKYVMVNSKGQTLAVPSQPISPWSNFTVTWKAAK